MPNKKRKKKLLNLDLAKAGHTPASELGQLTGYKSFAQVYL